MRRTFHTILILLFALGASLHAGGSLTPPGRLSFKAYGAEQGLANLSPWAMVQDTTGFLWVGTEDGLFRFDGTRFHGFGAKEGMPSVFVESLHGVPDGSLWVGTYRGLCRYREGRFTVFGPDKGLPMAPIIGLASDAQGRLLVATPEALFRGTAETGFQRVPGLPGGVITALYARPGLESVWVATWANSRAALHHLRGAHWEPAPGKLGLDRERIDALAVDGKGTVWARSLQKLWRRPQGADSFEVASPAVPAARQKGCLYVDPRGRLWVTTSKGLYRDLGGAWDCLGGSSGVSADKLLLAMEDREGSIWVAGVGVFRLQGGGVLRAYTAADGLPNEVIWNIFRSRSGDLLVGTDAGLVKADGNAWRLVPGTGNFQVRSIVQGPEGALYIAGGPAILRVDPKGGVQTFGSAQGVITAGRIYRLLFDREGTLWAGTDGGGLLKGTRRRTAWSFQKEPLPEGSPAERIYDLVEDPSGRLLAVGEKGLAVREGGAWRRYTSRDGLRNDHLNYARVMKNGDLILSYFEALGLCRARLSSGGLQVVEHLDDRFAPEKMVYQFAEDARGNLWIGSGRGLTMITPDRAIEQFGRGEGLVSEDTNAMAILPEANGDVWIGTSGGLARFDAASYFGSPRPPVTALLECRLGETSYVSTGAPPKVPHGQRTFTVRYAGLSFSREGAVQHQVHLEGLEDEWHASDTHEERYPALPAGKYRFVARSRVGLGQWGPISSFEFEILPAWWETWWFRGVLALFFGGLLLLFFRWRVAHFRRQNRQLEAMVAARTTEVEAKAAELAVANEALRNQSLTDPLTGLRNRRYLGVCMPEDVAQVQRVHRDVITSRTDRVLLNIDLVFLMVDIDHFKHINDHHGHSAGDRVLRQVGEILQKATRDSDTVVRWGGEEFLVVARNAARGESAILAERIRSQMEQHVFDLEDGTTLHRTCSIGFTFFPFVPEKPGLLPWEMVLDIADHCLYAAKRGGRNAWVGLVPTPEGDCDRIKASIPAHIPELIASGDIVVTSSLQDPSQLEWNLKEHA